MRPISLQAQNNEPGAAGGFPHPDRTARILYDKMNTSLDRYVNILLIGYQGTHSNCIFKFSVFSLSDGNLPIYVISYYFTHKTDLADLSVLKKNGNFCGKY